MVEVLDMLKNSKRTHNLSTLTEICYNEVVKIQMEKGYGRNRANEKIDWPSLPEVGEFTVHGIGL